MMVSDIYAVTDTVISINVLILVLMDDGLWPMKKIFFEGGFHKS